MRLHWFFAALLLAAALTYMQSEAVLHSLYWRYDWFDNVMHFLGGATIGTFLIGLLFKRRIALYIGLLIVAFIGWEIFEFYAGLPREAAYVLDTMSDLTMDTLGAIVAYLFARRTLWLSK